jgi:hypothetical protein
VFEGKQGRAGSTVDTDLQVNVLDVVLSSPWRHDEPAGDLLVGQALGDEPKHVYLAVRETGRPRSPPPGDVITAGRLDDRIHGVAIEATSSRFGTYELRRHLRVERPAIRTPLHERMERISRRKDPGLGREVSPGDAAVLARGIQTLVMHADQTRKRCESGRAAEQAFPVVGKQPYLLPLRRPKWARSSPHA